MIGLGPPFRCRCCGACAAAEPAKCRISAARSSVVVRHRDVLKEAISEDSDVLVHDVLVRFCAAFTDQGFAQRHLPNRDDGFFKALLPTTGSHGRFGDRWLRGLSKDWPRLEAAGTSPLESILESLELLGVNDDDWDDFIPATLLALRGWSGILSQMEVRSDRVAVGAPAGSLVEFLAVRLDSGSFGSGAHRTATAQV